MSGKYNKNYAFFLSAYRVGLRASQSIRQSMQHPTLGQGLYVVVTVINMGAERRGKK